MLPKKRRRTTELRPGRQTISVFEIDPSPENRLLYRDRTVADGDFARLVASIRAEGVQAPLLVSRDRFIISGHQRRAATIEAGRSRVPIIVLKLRRADFNGNEWLIILREHNTGREKTFDELVREKLLDIDPQEAADNLQADRAKANRPREIS